MKKQALNPYLPSWEYVPDGDHMYLMDEFMCMAHMIFTMVMYFVWGITFAGLHQWMIWVTGDTRVLFIEKQMIR